MPASRLGEALPRDMIAVPLEASARFLVVAAPGYLAAHPAPHAPDDLMGHACIRQRLPSGKLYRWEFERSGQALALDVPGALTLDHTELMVEAAAAGLGLAYVPERCARPWLDRGALAIVLEDWCPPIPGLFLYYPGHRHVPPPLRAFIGTIKAVGKAAMAG